MPIFVRAVVRAIQDYPMINISVNGDQILKKKNINIGMATALPDGNLIVPVIKNADQERIFINYIKNYDGIKLKIRRKETLFF